MGVLQKTKQNSYIARKHHHTRFTVTIPNGASRYSAMTFNTFSNTQTVTITYGGVAIVYTAVTALGAPAANNVQVKVQGTLAATVALLAQAIRGVTDVTNIAYGAGTQPNPNITGHYTGVRTSIGDVTHPAGPNLRLRENAFDRRDSVSPWTVTDTTTHAGLYLLTAPIRTYYFTYVENNNDAAANESIAGDMQCIVPPGVVVDENGRLLAYDPNKFVVEQVQDTGLIEIDTYRSLNEIDFYIMTQGGELSRETLSAGSQEYNFSCDRLDPGWGLYCRIRAKDSNAAHTVKGKFQMHVYPYGV